MSPSLSIIEQREVKGILEDQMETSSLSPSPSPSEIISMNFFSTFILLISLSHRKQKPLPASGHYGTKDTLDVHLDIHSVTELLSNLMLRGFL